MILSRKLLLLAGQAVDGVGLGRHTLRRAGRTQTFREHRAYVPGDDLRHVDWHVLARKDQLAVKVFEDEAPIRVELVVDASGSMGVHRKFEQQQVLALAVAQVALASGEEVGLHVLGHEPQHLRRLVQAAAGSGHLQAMSSALAGIICSGGTPVMEALTALSHRLRRRSHIIFFSDFWCDVSRLGGVIRKLTSSRHDVTLVHFWHTDEAKLPVVGQARWLGLEGEDDVVADSELLRADYREAALLHQRNIQISCARAGGVVVAALNSTKLIQTLKFILSAQDTHKTKLRPQLRLITI